MAVQFEEASFVDVEVIIDVDDVEETDKCDAPDLSTRVDADIEGVKSGQAIGVVGRDFLRKAQDIGIVEYIGVYDKCVFWATGGIPPFG